MFAAIKLFVRWPISAIHEHEVGRKTTKLYILRW